MGSAQRFASQKLCGFSKGKNRRVRKARTLRYAGCILLRLSTVESRAMKFNPWSWMKYLVAIVLGQALYFSVSPHLPSAARHQRFQFDLGTVIDFWFCLFVYGIIELVVFLRNRAR